ncbi:hypothetical protein TRICI_000336 [Trichomonascus ciferrii]|uniref:Uncharacterized protein n=1 Tax=Trichomonascus ciferrii TaxID=44093 RepID=A0A642VDQ0_9ASCO|nr:hypothetical protein TRICI_000336 [Trichomonascus ciferrii]
MTSLKMLQDAKAESYSSTEANTSVPTSPSAQRLKNVARHIAPLPGYSNQIWPNRPSPLDALGHPPSFSTVRDVMKISDFFHTALARYDQRDVKPEDPILVLITFLFSDEGIQMRTDQAWAKASKRNNCQNPRGNYRKKSSSPKDPVLQKDTPAISSNESPWSIRHPTNPELV